MDAALMLAVLLIIFAVIIPSYILFVKIMKDHPYMRKTLKEIRKITENDLKIE